MFLRSGLRRKKGNVRFLYGGGGVPQVVRRNTTILELHVRPESTGKQRERMLHQWYRQHLKELMGMFIMIRTDDTIFLL